MNNIKVSSIVLALAFSLNIESYRVQAQELTKREKPLSFIPAASNPVVGSGTVGRLPKWAGSGGINTSIIADSNIFEDKFGKIGIGTIAPTSPLTVQGMIETTLGGLKLPDGTVQTTAFDPGQVVRSLNGLTGNVQIAAGANVTITPAGNTLTVAAPNALTSVVHDTTLTGSGTAASPLGVAQTGAGIQVRSLDNPAQHPFTQVVPENTALNPVPQGKRFVIEFISGIIEIPSRPSAVDRVSIKVSTTVGANDAAHTHYLIAYLSPAGTLVTRYTISQSVKLILEPGEHVVVSNDPGGLLEITFAGHLVDIIQQ